MPRLSKTVDYNSEVEKPEMKYVHISPGSSLEFDSETDYEIFDQYGHLLKKGREKIIDCKKLKKGSYYINYDKEMGEFVIY